MGLVVATLIVIVVIASIIAQEPAVLSWAYWQQGGGGASRSEIFRNFGLLAVAIIGLGFGVWRAYTAYLQAKAANDQARIAQQGHFTERFYKAAEHLGHSQLHVRLGGIYALWRLSRDSQTRDLESIIDILCAFVRNPTNGSSVNPRPPPEAEQDGKEAAGKSLGLRTDVQVVLNLLGDEKADYRGRLSKDYQLNFEGAELANAELWRANLAHANLTGAILVGAMLSDANLGHAILTGANLKGASLEEAILNQADVVAACLTEANLSQAKLQGANLSGADIKQTGLTGADLRGAKLINAHLEGADLMGADFTGADLSVAILEGANNIPDLSEACANPNFPPVGLPKSVKRPEHWKHWKPLKHSPK